LEAELAGNRGWVARGWKNVTALAFKLQTKQEKENKEGKTKKINKKKKKKKKERKVGKEEGGLRSLGRQ
jgi:hypothetical protein